MNLFNKIKTGFMYNTVKPESKKMLIYKDQFFKREKNTLENYIPSNSKKDKLYTNLYATNPELFVEFNKLNVDRDVKNKLLDLIASKSIELAGQLVLKYWMKQTKNTHNIDEQINNIISKVLTIFPKELYNVYLTGSYTLNKLGFIERQANDLDFWVQAKTAKAYKNEINGLHRINYTDDNYINLTETYVKIYKLKIFGIKIDFFVTMLEPILLDNVYLSNIDEKIKITHPFETWSWKKSYFNEKTIKDSAFVNKTVT